MTYHENNEHKKKQKKEWHKEHVAGGFRCAHCRRWVSISAYMGTANRNHCADCLWSKHVDIKKGDRKEECRGGMKPVGLTFKHEGHGRQGELMIIHQCAVCGHLSINRIAADDNNDSILVAFEHSCNISGELSGQLLGENITYLTVADEREVLSQLFGKR